MRLELQFVCPSCGKTELEEVQKGTSYESVISVQYDTTNDESENNWGDVNNDNMEAQGYFCPYCEHYMGFSQEELVDKLMELPINEPIKLIREGKGTPDVMDRAILTLMEIRGITTVGGTLWRYGSCLEAWEADVQARDCGYGYAEQLVKFLEAHHV